MDNRLEAARQWLLDGLTALDLSRRREALLGGFPWWVDAVAMDDEQAALERLAKMQVLGNVPLPPPAQRTIQPGGGAHFAPVVATAAGAPPPLSHVLSLPCLVFP